MHRRESIMQAVTTALTGLATTGANIERARAYAVAALPALTLNQGNDQRNDDFEDLPGVDRRLDIEITAHVQQASSAETTLNQIEAEVYAALLTDRSQGLAYVLDTQWASTDAPSHEGEDTDTRVARMSMTFTIDYEHSPTSTEA